jgi:Uma2 family endonuclease
MATSTALPVEEYLSKTYDPDVAYVDGQLLKRHVSEYMHSMLQMLLGGELFARSRQRRFRVFSEQRIRIDNQPRYRIPDLCVKALPHPVTSILKQPDLVIEIVSPDDSISDMPVKIADYHAAGIPYVWIVDPYKRTLTEVLEGEIRTPATQTLSTPLVGEVDFAPLFEQLDEPAE